MILKINVNKFYSLPKYILWPAVILIAFFGGLPFGLTMMFAFKYSFLYLFLFPLVLPVAIFSSSPVLKVSGYFVYYSPMLLGIISKKKLDLHNGTTFDYFLNMKLIDSGTKARYKILSYYVEGLLNIISEIETGKIDSSIQIEGTSYFFSENTANKFGFKLQKPLFNYYFNFIFNFVDLCFMYSYSKAKFSVPNIFSIKRAVTTADELCKRKDYLISLNKVLKSRINIR